MNGPQKSAISWLGSKNIIILDHIFGLQPLIESMDVRWTDAKPVNSAANRRFKQSLIEMQMH